MTSSRTDQLTLDPRDHVVEFYGADDELAAPVSSYLGEGLKAGGSAVVMASAAHQLAFAAELVAAGIDVGAAQAAGRLLMLDASESLHGFLSGDRLDRARAAADEPPF
jgi:MEDS: MEthanogen/methylotroph, DcmR Sensory domain